MARINQDQREIRRRGARHHIAGVLHMPGAVGDDELAFRGREVAVRNINRDPLLTLGSEPIGEQRQVHALIASVHRRGFSRFELILEDGLGVIEQSPDERGFSIIDRATGQKPEQVHIEVGVGGKIHAFVGIWIGREVCFGFGISGHVLEVPFFFTIFHRGFVCFIIHPCAAFGCSGGGHFANNLFEIRCR